MLTRLFPTLLLLLVAAPQSWSQNQILIAQGDSLPGIGTVGDVGEVALGPDGRWAATVRVEGALASEVVLVLDGQVLFAPGDPLPGLNVEFLSASSLGFSDDGVLTWVGLGIGGSSPRSAVYRDSTPVLLAGTPLTGASVPPGTSIDRFFRVRTSSNGNLSMNVNAKDPTQQLGVTGGVALLRWTPQPVGTGLPEVIGIEGGPFGPFDAGATSFSSGTVDASGRQFAIAVGASQTTAVTSALVLDGEVVAASGSPSGVFGFDWASMASAGVSLADSGEVAFRASIESGSTARELLQFGDAIVAVEGNPVPGIADTSLAGLGGSFQAPIELDASARLWWFAQWDGPAGPSAGLFRDLDPIAQQGVTLAEGFEIDDWLPVNSDGDLRVRFDVAPDGSSFVARVGLGDGRQAAVRIDVDPALEVVPGCVGNPGTLDGLPIELGDPLLLFMGSGQSLGALGLTVTSTSPAVAGGTCGVDVPGLGELLVGIQPTQVLALTGTQPWPGTGDVLAVAGQVPFNPALLGFELWSQGVWIDATNPIEPFRLTNGLRQRLGL